MKIPFTRFEFKKANPNNIEIDKALYESTIAMNEKFKDNRPGLEWRTTLSDGEAIMPNYPLTPEIVYDTAKFSDVLRTILQNLRKEIFRSGYEIKENFSVKCKGCGKEYENVVDQCDDCEGFDFYTPDITQKKQLIEFCKNVNENGQDIIKSMEQFEDDLNTMDDAYILFTKDYYFSNEGKIILEVPVEIVRCEPLYMRIVSDKMGRPGRTPTGEMQMFCTEHRNKILKDLTRCPECGKQTLVAHFRATKPTGEFMYYGKNEVKHVSKYNPTLTYGFSPIFSVWMKVVTLMNMDVYMKDYYAKQRPPRGLLAVNTPNMSSLEKAWNWMTDQFKRNPHTIPPLAIENPNGGRGKLVEFIDFMKSLDEMQFTAVRDEFSRKIGAVYGVMPLYQADITKSGGLNNESLQISVTNRAIEDGQGIYNEEMFPWICKQLGVTDYKIELLPNEEEDMRAEEELKGMRIDNARKMQEMGFNVIYNEEETFEYSPLDQEVEKPNPFMGVQNPFNDKKPEDKTIGETERDHGQPPKPRIEKSVGSFTWEVDDILKSAKAQPKQRKYRK